MSTEQLTDEQVAAAESLVREAGALPLKKLAPDSLVEALERRGLEKAAKVMRVPVDEQLAALVAREGDVPLAGLEKRLAGASGPEAKKSALALAAAGKVALVKEGKAERLLRADERIAGADELKSAGEALDELKALVKELDGRLARPAKGPVYAVLREDLARWREQVRALTGAAPPPVAAPPAPVAEPPAPPTPAPPAPESEPPAAAQHNEAVAERLLQTVQRLDRDPLLHLVYLPDLVREMGRDGVGVATVHAVLLEVSNAGKLDLRPESEPHRLPSADRAVCFTGPSGRLVSYVRMKQ